MKGGGADAHEQRITSLLARKAAERGYQAEAVTGYTPLSALLRAEDGSEDDEEARAVRSEALRALVDFIMQDGPEPLKVLKNFFATVHLLRPSKLPNWTCHDYAELFGETKAAHSWRVKKLGKVLEARGGRPIKARFQKAASATKNYSAAQKGNRNRRHGHGRPGEREAA